MSNKYLVKIAGMMDVARYAGNKLKHAFGVGEREYLSKTIGTNNPKKIMDLGESFNSFGTRRKVLQAKMKNVRPKDHAEYRQGLKQARNSFESDMRDLREKKLDARIITGVSALGAYKLHQKYQESQPREYPEYYQSTYQ